MGLRRVQLGRRLLVHQQRVEAGRAHAHAARAREQLLLLKHEITRNVWNGTGQ